MTKPKQDRRKSTKGTFDLRLLIQASLIVCGILAMWYSSETKAAIQEDRLSSHTVNKMLHPIYEELTKDFVPRTEVELQLNNMDKHLNSIDSEVIKLREAVMYIRNNMKVKD